MALNGKYLLPGKFGAQPAHFIIASLAYDRMNATAEIRLAAYYDSDSRQAAKDAMASVAELQQEAEALRSKQEKGAASADEKTQANLSMQAKQLDLRFAQARKAIADNPAVQAPDIVRVGADRIGEILTKDGNVDLGKTYKLLKTLPQFAEATDA